MKKTVCEINKCNACMACIDKCPKKCISIVDNLEYINAIKDFSKCINCQLCEKICPNNITIKKIKPIEWKQGWTEQIDIRKNSSSGGVASAIIKYFVESGGYVASCFFNGKDFVFDITNDINMLKKFSGSKYVKSNPIGIYKKIEEKLKTNKVLFIGLPCQVASLKKIFGNNDNLYLIDLICHGTPSKQLLFSYLNEIGYDVNNINDIKFREKNEFGIILNSKKIRDKHITDEYSFAFLNSLIYTENCYSCNYASIERVSDLTLGDSWGSELFSQVNNGISLILIQNDKGKELILNANVKLYDVDLEKAIKNNQQLIEPSKLPKKRKKIFLEIKNNKKFKNIIFKLFPQFVIKQKIKSLLIKLKMIK